MTDYRIALTAVWVLGALTSVGLIIAHLVLLNPSSYLDSPDGVAVLNSHARIVLAIAVTFAGFIAWVVTGDKQHREPAEPVQAEPAPATAGTGYTEDL